MRRKFVFVGLVACLLAFSGLFAASSRSLSQRAGGLRDATPTTHLTISAINTFVGRAVFHLDCDPAGGDVPNPGRACAAIAASPQLITQAKPFVCAGGTQSWWDVTISGRFHGQPIRRAFSTCWTPQMATLGRLDLSWKVLRAHLVPRRQVSVLAGTKRVFPSGALRPSDLVTCDIRGHHLELGVPSVIGHPIFTGFNGQNVVAVSLSVTRHADGSVTAACLVVR